MWNRIESSITNTDIADIKAAVETLIAKLPNKGLTIDEWKKGGWALSKKRELFYKAALSVAKLRPADFPALDLAAFERDIKFMDDLEEIKMHLRRLESHAEGVRRWAVKDVSEQSRYVYKTVKVFDELGVDGGYAHKRLKNYMPRAKKQEEE